ncbi:MAG: aldehyde dehydrogenase family protein [Candidatus Eremiobacteraeota bacterium]|nr:aldehyde dehydrogenase family protein [Candidatus Eremiobacteraeota bacterium]
MPAVIAKYDVKAILNRLGIEKVNYGAFNGEWFGNGKKIVSVSPTNGEVLAEVIQADEEDYEKVYEKAREAFEMWRMYPAPKRGEIVRQIAQELRKHKDDLGALVTLEMGKILPEGLGEVQEMIDISDFAVGLSRQLYGLSMHSERPGHRMYEQWHPRGVIGIISAFNFPVAVWAWNAMLAAVCGDTAIWKPSSKAPLCGIACIKIVQKVFERNNLPPAIMSLIIGKGSEIGEKLINDKRIPLISATGSTRMGRRIGEAVGKRLGRTILELGGNNAIVVSDKANLDLALRAILFGAVGTAGQRCTTTRRIIAHRDVYDKLLDMLVKGYKFVSIGDPMKPNTLMGPLIDKAAVENMMNAIEAIKKEGGEIVCGGEVLKGEKFSTGTYVTPCIAKVENHYDIVQSETFAPILYFIKYDNIDDAIKIHNDVPQGLSSAIFTTDLLEAEQFLSAVGSDCGIANANIGTSGAEIGGAFGGEKDTGGGRESGSDAWKGYMRRQTCTINWSKELPLAQGIQFDTGE